MGRPPRMPSPDGRWQCSKCKDWKPSNQFYKSTSTAHGLTYYCKECQAGPHRETRIKRQTIAYRERLDADYRDLVSEEDKDQVAALYAESKRDPSLSYAWSVAEQVLEKEAVAEQLSRQYGETQSLQRIVKDDGTQTIHTGAGTDYDFVPIGPPPSGPKEVRRMTQEEIIAQASLPWKRPDGTLTDD